MSTVGYGDVSVAGEATWRVFIGIVFMFASVVVGLTVFSTAAEAAMNSVGVSPSRYALSKYLSRMVDNYDGTSVPLYKQIRRILYLRVAELVVYFLFFNLIGIFLARIFVRDAELYGAQWSWMTTFYWSVQTTTTIGKLRES